MTSATISISATEHNTSPWHWYNNFGQHKLKFKVTALRPVNADSARLWNLSHSLSEYPMYWIYHGFIHEILHGFIHEFLQGLFHEFLHGYRHGFVHGFLHGNIEFRHGFSEYMTWINAVKFFVICSQNSHEFVYAVQLWVFHPHHMFMHKCVPRNS